MNYILRETTIEDIPTLASIMKDSFTMEPYLEDWSLDSTTERLLSIYKMPNSFCFTLFNEKGDILGGAFSYVLPYLERKEAFLIEFFIRKDETGQHLGSRFLQAYLDESRKDGISKVALYTYKNLKLFYKKNGFEESRETLMEVSL